MQISIAVTDTTRATIQATSADRPYYIVVEMLEGEVKSACLRHWSDAAPYGLEDISILFTDNEAPAMLERIREAIVAEAARIAAKALADFAEAYEAAMEELEDEEE